jgi:ribosomal protein S18 acetylase RimI-like enzyme
MEVSIRPARLEDAVALQRHCYPGASLGDVEDYLAWCLRRASRGHITRLVAEVDGQAVANAQLTVWKDRGEIGSVVVGEEYRRRGLARRLITDLIAEARRRDLPALEIAVRQDRPSIVAFYRGLGFEPLAGEDVGGIKNGLSHPACSEPVIHLWMWLQSR